MIENIKLGLEITDINDIYTFNLLIMKGIFKIPRTKEEKLKQFKFKAQMEAMADAYNTVKTEHNGNN